MRSKRSRAGCLECRRRKIKCSEDRPVCAQCEKSSRVCVPSDGITFRHQQNASMQYGDEDDGDNGAGMGGRGGAGAGSRLKSFYAYKNTFEAGSTWVRIPKELTFVELRAADVLAEHGSDYEQPLVSSTPLSMEHDYTRIGWSTPPSAVEVAATRGLEVLSAAASGDHFQYSKTPHPSDATPTLRANSKTLHHSMPSVSASAAASTAALNASSSLRRSTARYGKDTPSSVGSPQNPLSLVLNSTSPSSTDLTSSSSNRATSRVFDTLEYDENRETAFLLRHFSEGPGNWMDLFDIAMFFSHHLPKEADRSPVLKHSAAAVAAKHLGRVKGRKLPIDGASLQPPPSNFYPGSHKADWEYKSTQHYHKAVKLLKKAVFDTRLTQSHMIGVPAKYHDPIDANEDDDQQSSVQDDSSSPPLDGQKRRRIGLEADFVGSDELAAATAILCVYEFMDLSNSEWSHHLDGTKSLLDLAERSMMPLHPPSNLIRAPISKARKSTFWNFARQDFLSALINQTQTRLDTEDLLLWKDAGLLLDEDGYVQPAIARNSWLPEDDNIAKEDMLSNALVWLMAKLVNYAVAADSPPQLDGHTYPTYMGVDQTTLHQRWSEIEKQIEVWRAGLPISFRPSYERAANPDRRSHTTDSDGDVFGEKWFAKPMCGSTIMGYNWARILLLINQPHESTLRNTTVFKRYRLYQHTTAATRAHAREICAIAMSRPEASVRINSVQPLFFAGQILEQPAERRIIARLLQDIERDTGWATEYRVKQLQEYWSADLQGVE